MMDDAVILKDARMIPMARPKMEINKIGFGTRVLRAATQGNISTPEMGETGTRALARADRYLPQLSRIPWKPPKSSRKSTSRTRSLEDSIEGGDIDTAQFQQTILDMLAQRITLDLEELVILGDTGSGDNYLALQNGVLVQSVSNIVNHGGDPMSVNMFGNAVKALPTKYHKLLSQYRFYVSKTKEIDYRLSVAQRQTRSVTRSSRARSRFR
jgi:hypothetical protein